jgi:hypothetical protein
MKTRIRWLVLAPDSGQSGIADAAGLTESGSKVPPGRLNERG